MGDGEGKNDGAGVSGSASQKDDLRSTGRSVNLPPHMGQNIPSQRRYVARAGMA